ncbi:MAG: ABC transporter ATP-binding protein [Gammaproteobacteria bacterium]|nr:ABC transporter ATP-binding protein [Gammaproteobacteria bacterium]
MALLEVDSFGLAFSTRDGVVDALDSVSFTVARGEIVGLVGESGSGKSVTAYAIMGLSDPAAHVTGGGLNFGGLDLVNASEQSLREVRGREIAMIFQNPRAALNPIRKIGRQIEDVIRRHVPTPRSQLKQAAVRALAAVQVPDPERRYHAYPYELSGGLCQRVLIAMAFACKPALLIADEPTTGLDVTTQAVIMDLLRVSARKHNMSALLITHDLALAAQYCDRIVVMHAGHVIESAPSTALFARPSHPYTQRLILATPREESSVDSLQTIAGNLPDLRQQLPPCRFFERCERRQEICAAEPLPRLNLDDNHFVACRFPA